MSKKTKIIIGFLAIVLIIGIVVFNYLLSTEKIKFKAAQPAAQGTVIDIYSWDDFQNYAKENSRPDYGMMTQMWITNSTARGVEGNKLIAQPGDTLTIGVTIKSNIAELTAPITYNGTQDKGNRMVYERSV